MTVDQLKKYLEFLLKEIYRHQEDFEITEDELLLFNNELNRLKELSALSDEIDDNVKKIINNLKFDEGKKQRKLKKGFWFSVYDRWSAADKAQEDNKSVFAEIERDIKTILYALMLKTNDK